MAQQKQKNYDLYVDFFNKNQDKFKISFDEFNKYFFVDEYFSTNDLVNIEKRFLSITSQILLNVCNRTLNYMEYFMNLRPNTPREFVLQEVLEKYSKEKSELYFRIHKDFNNLNLYYILREDDIEKLISYFDTFLENLRGFNIFLKNISVESNGKFDTSLKEIDTKKSINFESSAYQ